MLFIAHRISELLEIHDRYNKDSETKMCQQHATPSVQHILSCTAYAQETCETLVLRASHIFRISILVAAGKMLCVQLCICEV